MTPGAEIEPGPHWWKASTLTTRPTLPPGYLMYLMLFNAKVWQNMTCDNEFDENEFQPSLGNEVNGLPISNSGTLIDSLSPWDNIPDIYSFRETSISNQNYKLHD